MFRVKYFKDHVYQYSPDMVATFSTLEEARIFAKTIIAKVAECVAVHVEMDPEIYGPEDPEEVGEE